MVGLREVITKHCQAVKVTTRVQVLSMVQATSNILGAHTSNVQSMLDTLVSENILLVKRTITNNGNTQNEKMKYYLWKASEGDDDIEELVQQMSSSKLRQMAEKKRNLKVDKLKTQSKKSVKSKKKSQKKKSKKLKKLKKNKRATPQRPSERNNAKKNQHFINYQRKKNSLLVRQWSHAPGKYNTKSEWRAVHRVWKHCS